MSEYDNMSLDELQRLKSELEAQLSANGGQPVSRQVQTPSMPKNTLEAAKQVGQAYKKIGASYLASATTSLGNLYLANIADPFLSKEEAAKQRAALQSTRQMYRDIAGEGPGRQQVENLGELLTDTLIPGNRARSLIPGAGIIAASQGSIDKPTNPVDYLTRFAVGATTAGAFHGAGKLAQKGRDIAQSPEFQQNLAAIRAQGLSPTLGRTLPREHGRREHITGSKENQMIQGEEVVKKGEEFYNSLLDDMSLGQRDGIRDLSSKALKNFTSRAEIQTPISNTNQQFFSNDDLNKIASIGTSLESKTATPEASKLVRDNITRTLSEFSDPNLTVQKGWEMRQLLDERLDGLVNSGSITKNQAKKAASQMRSIVEKNLESFANKAGVGAEYKTMKYTYQKERNYAELLDKIGLSRKSTPDYYTPDGYIDPIKLVSKLGKWKTEVTNTYGKVKPEYKETISQSSVDRLADLEKGVRLYSDSVKKFLNRESFHKVLAENRLTYSDVGMTALMLVPKSLNSLYKGANSFVLSNPKMIPILEQLGKYPKNSKNAEDMVIKLFSLGAGNAASEGTTNILNSEGNNGNN